MNFRLIEADCVEAMAAMDEASVDAIVTDPPYGLEFMGKEWDSFKVGRSDRYGNHAGLSGSSPSGRSQDKGDYSWFGSAAARPTYLQRPAKRCANCGKQSWSGSPCVCPEPRWVLDNSPLHAYQAWTTSWAVQALRVLKPGGHLLAFGGTRTFHRLTCGLEDAGFEIRDCLSWLYGQGFAKSLNLDNLTDSPACQCWKGESADGEPQAEHGVRPVRDTDLPTTVDVADQHGQVLFEGVSEQGVSAAGRPQPAAPIRASEPGMEGRRDAQAAEGQLHGRPLRESAGVGVADGTQGRLHHGAPASDGTDVRAAVDADGSGESPRPRSVEQRPEQPGALADEPGPQAGGVWPVCARCGKPRIPRGLGTALKPAWEPVILARKPTRGTVAANVTRYGTGAINVDGCRIGFVSDADEAEAKDKNRHADFGSGPRDNHVFGEDNRPRGEHGNYDAPGRWPANVVLDEAAAALLDEQSGERPGYRSQNHLTPADKFERTYSGGLPMPLGRAEGYDDTGGASRFFYVAKADRAERERGVEHCTRQALLWSSGEQSPGTFQAEGTLREAANFHPTVKPVALMQWLVRLVTPPGGVVLDPFTGSGSTGIAALREGFEFIGIEREHDYCEIARDRIVGDAPLFNQEAAALLPEEGA